MQLCIALQARNAMFESEYIQCLLELIIIVKNLLFSSPMVPVAGLFYILLISLVKRTSGKGKLQKLEEIPHTIPVSKAVPPETGSRFNPFHDA